jgi:hypothetical protein
LEVAGIVFCDPNHPMRPDSREEILLTYQQHASWELIQSTGVAPRKTIMIETRAGMSEVTGRDSATAQSPIEVGSASVTHFHDLHVYFIFNLTCLLPRAYHPAIMAKAQRVYRSSIFPCIGAFPLHGPKYGWK